MTDLSNIAERLRAVRERENEFLGRFAAESLFDRPIFLDCVLADLERSDTQAAPGSSAESALGSRNHQQWK